jgi:hypothetical protein
MVPLDSIFDKNSNDTKIGENRHVKLKILILQFAVKFLIVSEKLSEIVSRMEKLPIQKL